MSESESSGGGFFDGFAWALPQAFAGPVAACRFEQGDVLYPHRGAYAGPGETASATDPLAGWALQVRGPARSARSAVGDGEGASRRSANWVDPVALDLIDLSSGQTKRIDSTQGRLWTLLWKGPQADFEGRLDPDSDPPQEPLGARALQAQLSEGLPVFDAASPAKPGAGTGPKRSKRKRAAATGIRFVQVVDLASDASRAKSALVADHLQALGQCAQQDWSPGQAEVEDADRFSPTLVLRVFEVLGTTAEAAEAALKTALYRGGQTEPSAIPESDADAPADRFSVSRHGLLTAIE